MMGVSPDGAGPSQAEPVVSALRAAVPNALAERIERAEKKAWQGGYLIAVSTMLHQHGCTVTAKDALLDSGITWAEVRKQGFDSFDLDLLRPIYDEINAQKRWSRKEARRKAAAIRARNRETE